MRSIGEQRRWPHAPVHVHPLFKSAQELQKVFKKADIDLTKPSVAHCQSGGRSSVMVFAMELMGASDVRNYYRSWAEWGNADDTPIELPKKK